MSFNLACTLSLIFILSGRASAYNLEYEDMDTLTMCSNIPSFIRRNTNMKCTSDQTTMRIYYNATLRANYDCQRQFKMRPWNCTSNSRYVSKLAVYSFPETSYLYAIHSAALAHSFTHACANGHIPACHCSATDGYVMYRRDDQLFKENYQCTGKSILYGIVLSKRILTNTKESDSRWMIDNHNKEAGRNALLAKELPKRALCRCHGVSGACAVKKCIRRIPNFSEIGDILMKKYLSAIKVGVDNSVSYLIPSTKTMIPPTKEDLVYSEESPLFCNEDRRYGSLGTVGRKCDIEGTGPGSCDVLCCNRGYDTNKHNVTGVCNCRFKYCCTVKCDSCNKTITTYTCR